MSYEDWAGMGPENAEALATGLAEAEREPLIPICAGCYARRDAEGHWHPGQKPRDDSGNYTHGLCDECLRRLYPDEAEEVIAARDN